MAINNNPTFAWGQDLSPEQLAQLFALLPGGWTPQSRTYEERETGTVDTTPNNWYMPGDKFAPGLQWTRNQVPRGTGTGADAEWMEDPSGAGSFGIFQPRNISTWGGSDATGAWDENGKWQGFGSGATDMRGLANFIASSVASYYGVQGMEGGGAAAATTPAEQGINWSTVGANAGKGALTNAGMTAAQGGDLDSILKAAAVGAVSGGAGGVGQGMGWNPTVTGAVTGGGITAARGGDTEDILRGAAAGGFSNYANGLTGNQVVDRAIAGGGSAAIRGSDGQGILTGAVQGGLNGAARSGGNGLLDANGDALSEGNVIRFDDGGNMGNEGDWYADESFDWGKWLQEQMASGADFGAANNYSHEGDNYKTPDSTQGPGGSPVNASMDWQNTDWGKMLSGLFKGTNLGTLLGAGLGYMDGKDRTNTSTRDPWGPTQPYAKSMLEEGANLYNRYKSQPFSPAQQTAYGNLGGLLDSVNANAGGLLQGLGANATGANNYDRANPRKQLTGSAALDLSKWLPGLLGNFGTGGR